MPEGGLTCASSLRCLPHKTASKNTLDEHESNAVLDDSGLDLEEPVTGGTIWSILSESGVNTNTCGRANSIWIHWARSHNVWTRIFSYPERKSCGLKNIQIRGAGVYRKAMSHSQNLSRNLQSITWWKCYFFPRVKRKTNSNHFENFCRTLSSSSVKLHCIDVAPLNVDKKKVNT